MNATSSEIWKTKSTLKVFRVAVKMVSNTPKHHLETEGKHPKSTAWSQRNGGQSSKHENNVLKFAVKSTKATIKSGKRASCWKEGSSLSLRNPTWRSVRVQNKRPQIEQRHWQPGVAAAAEGPKPRGLSGGCGLLSAVKITKCCKNEPTNTYFYFYFVRFPTLNQRAELQLN